MSSGSHCSTIRDSPRRLPRWDRQICGPDQIPIGLRTILAIEAHLAKCEMLHDKLVELGANEELSLGMREQLLGTLTRAKASIEARYVVGAIVGIGAALVPTAVAACAVVVTLAIVAAIKRWAPADATPVARALR